MAKPFGSFEDFKEQEDARREVNYGAKILRKILKVLYAEEAQQMERAAHDEFGFRWFNATTAQGIFIDATKDTVSIPDLLKTEGITKTKLWQTYFDLRSEYGSPFALIFPLPGLRHWVMHNSASLALLPGHAHIVRKSEQRQTQLTIQPLEAFLSALAGS